VFCKMLHMNRSLFSSIVPADVTAVDNIFQKWPQQHLHDDSIAPV